MKAAQEPAVRWPGPANHASPTPSLAAQPIEPAVVGDPRERVGLHPVATGKAHLAETRPPLEQCGVRGGNRGESGTARRRVGQGQSLTQALELVGGLRGEDRLVARGRGRRAEAADWKILERARRSVRRHSERVMRISPGPLVRLLVAAAHRFRVLAVNGPDGARLARDIFARRLAVMSVILLSAAGVASCQSPSPTSTSS